MTSGHLGTWVCFRTVDGTATEMPSIPLPPLNSLDLSPFLLLTAFTRFKLPSLVASRSFSRAPLLELMTPSLVASRSSSRAPLLELMTPR
jgi:hypothetical protein